MDLTPVQVIPIEIGIESAQLTHFFCPICQKIGVGFYEKYCHDIPAILFDEFLLLAGVSDVETFGVV